MKNLIQKVARINLPRLYQMAKNSGSIPYKTNRDTVRAFDIEQDETNGRKLAIRLIREIDGWIISLEKLRDAAEVIEKDTDMADFS